MSLPKIEQETVIIYNREEPTATVNTYEPSLIRKLDELCQKSACFTVVSRGKGWGLYKIPRKQIKIVKPRYDTDKLSAESILRATAQTQNTKGEETNA